MCTNICMKAIEIQYGDENAIDIRACIGYFRAAKESEIRLNRLTQRETQEPLEEV